MGLGFTVSVGIRLVAMGWSLRTFARLRDWRAASVSVLVALLLAQAILALVGTAADDTETPNLLDVSSSLLVSLSALLTVVVLDRGLVAAKKPATEKPAPDKAALPDSRQLVRLDRLASIGALTSTVAHDMSNPTHTLQMSTELFQRAWVDVEPLLDERYSRDSSLRVAGVRYADLRKDLPQLFEDFRGGLARIKNVVSTLRSFSRAPADDEMRPVDVNEAVRNAVQRIGNRVRTSTSDLTEPLPLVDGSLQQLEQIVLNLLQNADEAMTEERATIRIATRVEGDPQRVVLTIEDKGCGISKGDQERILEPFFTTKQDSGGTGLGLTAASLIVSEHRGTLAYDSDVGRGTTMSVSLPVSVVGNVAGGETHDG
jgi:polar amino acid transport system substrate-binding protein